MAAGTRDPGRFVTTPERRAPSIRPAGAYLHGLDGPVVIVTGRVAAWLLTNTSLPQLRAQVRGADPEIDAGLIALTNAGLHWRTSAATSDSGSALVDEAEVAPALDSMSTGQAAEALGIGDRAVRLAIAKGRLKAQQIGGRWLVDREDIEQYRAGRTAA